MNTIKVYINYDNINIILNEDKEKFTLKVNNNIIIFHKFCFITKGEGDNIVNLCLKYDDDLYLYNFNLLFSMYINQDSDFIKLLTDLFYKHRIFD